MYLKDVLRLIFPRNCVCCGKSLFDGEEYICALCEFHLPRTNFHREHDNPVSRIFWGRVRIEDAAAYCYFNKGNRVQQLVHKLKYRGETGVGVQLGKLYAYDLMSSGGFEDMDVVVPVPLHWKKLKKRGFNQSEMFAKGLSENLDIPMDTRSFIRAHPSQTQTKKSRIKRWENVKDVFRVKNPSLLSSKHILLVDDVITTGATLEACATKLLELEDVKVSIASIAYSST